MTEFKPGQLVVISRTYKDLPAPAHIPGGTDYVYLAVGLYGVVLKVVPAYEACNYLLVAFGKQIFRISSRYVNKP